MAKKKSASKPKKAPLNTDDPMKLRLPLPPLDPKNDAIFKALFVDPEMNQSLMSLVTAVIKPIRPIVSLKVLNPEISIKYFKHRGCTLDILAELSDGTFVDIEMQMKREKSLKKRALHYWSRIYSGGLRKSQPYSKAHPTVVIFFLNYIHFSKRPQVAHHRYFATYEHDLTDRIEDFRLDFVELTKIPLAHQTDFADKDLVRWCQFFRDPNHPELQGEFMEDKNIKKAKERLIYLSGEPSMQELARMREKAAFNWAITIGDAREEGREEGELKQQEKLRNILLSGFGANKSVSELAKMVGCSKEMILAVKKTLESKSP